MNKTIPTLRLKEVLITERLSMYSGDFYRLQTGLTAFWIKTPSAQVQISTALNLKI